MKVVFDDGKEIEFDENEVALHHKERIFKKDGIWYITKIINKDFAKWLKICNENGLVIDLEEGKQTTVMPTLAVIDKLRELKGDSSNE